MNDLGQAAVSAGKAPRTERGRKTVRKLLEAAAQEFGQRGFHDAAITGITARAGVALGTFYTYFESKEALFRALVRDMSDATRQHVAEAVAGAPDRLAAERLGLAAFIAFTRRHPELYRIIEEAQFVAEDEYRAHYLTFVEGYRQGLAAARKRGRDRRGAGRAPRLGFDRDKRLPRHALRHLERGYGPRRGRRSRRRPGFRGLAQAMIGDLPDLIASRAALTPDRIALEDAASGRTLTYGTLECSRGASRSFACAHGG